MKVSVGSRVTKTKASEMEVGDVARIAETSYDGHFIVRTYDRLVSLTDPGMVWTMNPGPSFNVEILPPGTIITLTIE